MTIRTDCRHFSTRTVGTGDVLQRCRLDAAQVMPFDCPDGCLFFEPRAISGVGWHRDEPDDGEDQSTR